MLVDKNSYHSYLSPQGKIQLSIVTSHRGFAMKHVGLLLSDTFRMLRHLWKLVWSCWNLLSVMLLSPYSLFSYKNKNTSLKVWEHSVSNGRKPLVKFLNIGIGAVRCQQRGRAGPNYLCSPGHWGSQKDVSRGQDIHKVPKSSANNTVTKNSPGPILRWPSSSKIYVSLGETRRSIFKIVRRFGNFGARECLSYFYLKIN